METLNQSLARSMMAGGGSGDGDEGQFSEAGSCEAKGQRQNTLVGI